MIISIIIFCSSDVCATLNKNLLDSFYNNSEIDFKRVRFQEGENLIALEILNDR